MAVAPYSETHYETPPIPAPPQCCSVGLLAEFGAEVEVEVRGGGLAFVRRSY